MSVMNMIQALNSAHHVMMERDPDIVVLGEDIGYFGGVFRVTEGLQKKFGKARAFDSPISENGIVAIAVGMAAYGLRPVAEIQFADYIYPGFDQIVSEGRQDALPLGRRMASADGDPHALWRRHLRRPDAQPVARGLFTHIAGIKTVIPSNPYDAKGLLIAAIEDNDPVVFFEPKRIYNGPFDGYLRAAGDALGEASRGRGARRPLHRPARQGGGRPRRRGDHHPRLRHHGPRRPRHRRGGRGRRRGDRPAHARPASTSRRSRLR